MVRSLLSGLVLLSLAAACGAPAHRYDSWLGTAGEIAVRTVGGVLTLDFSEIFPESWAYQDAQRAVPITEGAATPREAILFFSAIYFG